MNGETARCPDCHTEQPVRRELDSKGCTQVRRVMHQVHSTGRLCPGSNTLVAKVPASTSTEQR